MEFIKLQFSCGANLRTSEMIAAAWRIIQGMQVEKMEIIELKLSCGATAVQVQNVEKTMSQLIFQRLGNRLICAVCAALILAG